MIASKYSSTFTNRHRVAAPIAQLNRLVRKQSYSNLNQNLPKWFPHLSASEWKVSEVFSHFHKFVVMKCYTFHQQVDGIDQNVPPGNLSENFPKARSLTQALTNNNLLLQGGRSTCSIMQWKFLWLISHNHQEFLPMHTAIPKRNLKNFLVRDRVLSVAAGKFFLCNPFIGVLTFTTSH